MLSLRVFLASTSCNSIIVVIPRLPAAPKAPWNKSAFSRSEAFPVGKSYFNGISCSIKKPYLKPQLKELISPLVPAKPPPAVIPGNSITTGGIRLYLRVDSTRRSIGTIGSTRGLHICLENV